MNVRYVMGTFLRLRVEGRDASEAREAFLGKVQALEAALSFYRPDSDVSRVNAAAGRAAAAVGAEAFEAASLALRFAARTNGAFDPTFRSPSQARFESVEINAAERTVFLREPGMLLDLGGIGKGFALDAALGLARERFEIESVVADFGGQWLFWKRDGALKETVVIEDPRDDRKNLETLTVDGNCSVATSSQAQRPGHLEDPRGGGVATAALSATAIAPTATEAEVLSTALFVLGPEGADALLKGFPGARAVVR